MLQIRFQIWARFWTFEYELDYLGVVVRYLGLYAAHTFIFLYLLGYFGILIGYFLSLDFHISLNLYLVVEVLVLVTLKYGVVF